MALARVLHQRQETPYSKPPPLHIFIVKLKSRPRAMNWIFNDSRAVPTNIRQNFVAAISDGKTLTTTTLFEEFSGRVKEGSSYIMRGYELRGEGPPFSLRVTPRTQFYRASHLNISEELQLRAATLLEPPAPLVALEDCPKAASLVTIEAEVTEVSETRKVTSGREQVPIRTIRVKQGTFTIPITLWREAATVTLNVGNTVSISHLKMAQTGYGDQLQSTVYTTVEVKEEVRTSQYIIGVLSEEPSTKENLLQVLFEDGSTGQVSEELWAPFEQLLEENKIKVDVKMSGNTIVEIKRV